MSPNKPQALILDTPWGPWILEANATGLTGFRPFDSTQEAEEVRMISRPEPGSPLALGQAWVEAYLTGKPSDPRCLPLAPQARTPFRDLVWDILLDIPYGATVTYGAIARTVARRQGRASMAPRAVGGAVGANPLAIFIPCHRVLAASGKLGGYAYGSDLKKALLAHERRMPWT